MNRNEVPFKPLVVSYILFILAEAPLLTTAGGLTITVIVWGGTSLVFAPLLVLLWILSDGRPALSTRKIATLLLVVIGIGLVLIGTWKIIASMHPSGMLHSVFTVVQYATWIYCIEVIIPSAFLVCWVCKRLVQL